jgi:hypothetical protein
MIGLNVILAAEGVCDSHISNIIINVPSVFIQGFVLGPLLFDIFVFDIPDVISSNIILHADNATPFIDIFNFCKKKKSFRKILF